MLGESNLINKCLKCQYSIADSHKCLKTRFKNYKSPFILLIPFMYYKCHTYATFPNTYSIIMNPCLPYSWTPRQSGASVRPLVRCCCRTGGRWRWRSWACLCGLPTESPPGYPWSRLQRSNNVTFCQTLGLVCNVQTTSDFVKPLVSSATFKQR